MNHSPARIASLAVVMSLAAVACGSTDDTTSSASVETAADADDTAVTVADTDTETETETETESASTDVGTATETETTVGDAATATSTYQIEIWADNWSAAYVNGALIGEDSVSITTERSFNSETFTFEASLPFTLAIEAKDFKETDSGIEYIGLQNQQMGDGGIIAQVTDLSTGEIVAATDADWSALVVHQAPLNTECEDDPDPDATCEFLIIDTPADWTSTGFDDSAWTNATEWSAAAVSPKDGYDDIAWDDSAQLIWGTDLEVDNTVLLRTTVS